MNAFKEANLKLDDFIQNNLNSYHKLRNYDFGAKSRANVSQISKYTTHRVLLEYEIIEKLKPIDIKKKFTDEILWRIYWKGYLETHKSIWNEYKTLKNISVDSTLVNNAKNGLTGIGCFDAWIEELRENNYLHNHARMWFASIWIFALKLPWQIGARLFMKHLLDGDAASNTLSWRWVAGMHTNNKPYIATQENIMKYSSNRFKNIPINISNEVHITKKVRHQSNRIPSKSNLSINNILFMFENDININNRYKLFNSYSKIYIVFNHFLENSYKLSKNVIRFKQTLIEDFNNLVPNAEIISDINLNTILKDLKSIDVIYPGVGSNLDLITKFSNLNKININFIYREEDILNWNQAKSGFSRFKSNFYLINNI